MINVTNEEFIEAIFGADAPWSHVTDFTYAPDNIPSGKHLFAWKGDYFSRYQFSDNTNQYFTISTFSADDQGTARRRKALYRRTHCVVLDDVKEKLDEVVAQQLPTPSWILETSEGSFQWGYILSEPCTVAARIDNLNDGLIESDLAPKGTDPGMRGVTRYVRLPEGVNNKTSKLVNGQPFKCRMLSWQPFNTVTLESLAKPFNINLDRPRRESRVDGAAAIDDHPLIVDAGDIVRIKEVRSDGRYDCTCPWVDEHTHADDSGSAVFTNDDGTIGFKCHHGACQHRTGADLLKKIEEVNNGFGERFNTWKVLRSFKDFGTTPTETSGSDRNDGVEQHGHIGSTQPDKTVRPSNIGTQTSVSPIAGYQTSDAEGVDPFKFALSQIRMQEPGTKMQREMAAEFLKLVEDANDKIRAKQLHDELRDILNWSKADLKDIISDLREQWYEATSTPDFFNEVVFVMEQNQFYDRKRRLFYTPEAYANAYADRDPEARKNALQNGLVSKVHKLDYAPKKPPVFEEDFCTYSNLWVDNGLPPMREGDCSVWLDHFKTLGWEQNRDTILKFMAFTILHPDQKVNWALLFGGPEGIGKDWLLYPLVYAMGRDSKTIAGQDLLSSFNSYVMGVKHLHINETELGDHREAMAISAKLKPLITAPPYTISVNQKNVKEVDIRNILNVTMSTNSRLPFKLTGPSRRYYALWSDLNTRCPNGEMLPEWKQFWQEAWAWMLNGGAEMCINHLINQVDLSDFSPGAAPPVTDFLRDIMDSSKSPMQKTIEDFMEAGVGHFKADVVAATDLAASLRMGGMPNTAHLMHVDPVRCTGVAVGRVLADVPGVIKKRGADNKGSARLYIIRNQHLYRDMGPSELISVYRQQVQSEGYTENTGMTKLTVVS